jgi:hypothetical protein
MSEDLKKIYGKFFDESGNMKESGKSIVKEGMKGINKASAEKYVSKAPAIKAFDEATKAGPKDFAERRMKLTATDALKAAKATKYGKIALGVVAAGVAAKQFLKSKMSDDKKEEPKNTNASVKAKRLKELEGELNINSKRGGGMIIARGYKLTKAKPTKLY